MAKKRAAPDTSSDWFVPITDTVEFTNSLFYGREGSGKTTAAARLANIDHPGKVLVINAEGGLKISPLRKRGIDVDKIMQWPNPAKHERVTHKSMEKIFFKIKADLEEDPDSWAGVIIDSVTEVYTSLLDSVQERRVQALINKGVDNVDTDFVDIADYGVMSKQFRDLMRKFRDLPCHVVFTALERRDVDKDTGKPQYGPDVTPGIQKDLLGYVDFVLMHKAQDEDGPFRALTKANSRYRAKDRFDALPKILIEPSVDRMIDYLNEDLTEESDPLQTKVTKRTAKAQDAADPEDEDEDDDE